MLWHWFPEAKITPRPLVSPQILSTLQLQHYFQEVISVELHSTCEMFAVRFSKLICLAEQFPCICKLFGFLYFRKNHTIHHSFMLFYLFSRIWSCPMVSIHGSHSLSNPSFSNLQWNLFIWQKQAHGFVGQNYTFWLTKILELTKSSLMSLDCQKSFVLLMLHGKTLFYSTWSPTLSFCLPVFYFDRKNLLKLQFNWQNDHNVILSEKIIT